VRPDYSDLVYRVGYRDGEIQVYLLFDQAVDARDHKGVARPQELQQQGELGAALMRGPADLLRAHNIVAGRPQGSLLQADVPVDRGPTRVALAGHGVRVVSVRFRPGHGSVSEPPRQLE
jgi:hypothetical protein